MRTKPIAAVLLILGGLVAGYYAFDLDTIWETQKNLDETADKADLQTCREIRESTCMTAENITEDDYPGSCFQNGEHILEGPYQCP